MLLEYRISTPRLDFYDITPKIREAIAESGVKDGIAVVYCPHTIFASLTRQGKGSFL
ncbi:MAG: YjbQ family protein [Fibromonadaceae bacterium]|jgi:thiamine phosphate synthase YjbQ (UPF0047 family)|nr:YjbQ family protein [Fibromonadaceae bacterium]